MNSYIIASSWQYLAANQMSPTYRILREGNFPLNYSTNINTFKLTQSKSSSVVKTTWNSQSVPGMWHNSEPWSISYPNLPSAASASLLPLEECCLHPAKLGNTPCSLWRQGRAVLFQSGHPGLCYIAGCFHLSWLHNIKWLTARTRQTQWLWGACRTSAWTERFLIPILIH